MIRYFLMTFLWFGSLSAAGQLQGKSAFVTGGSSGIGKAIVESFAEQGASVIFTYHRNEAAAQELVQKWDRPGRRFMAISMNLLDQASVLRSIDTVIREFPRLNVVVNNAAVLSTHEFMETEASELTQLLQTNVAVPFLISQSLAHQMIKQEIKGSIIHIGSFRGSRPVSRLFAYSTSKAALNAMTVMMANELAPKGIRVNLIAPGGTLTAMSRQIYDTEEKVRTRGDRVPLGRYGQPEDHTALAVYLASDASNWTTGAIIPVDGGESTAN